MGRKCNRRDALRSIGGLAAVVCGGALAQSGCTGFGVGGSCGGTPSPGTCLVDPSGSVRARGAKSLGVGEVIAVDVDGGTVLAVGRDAGGWFAVSMVCTHACCIVDLCADGSCQSIVSAPAPCQTSRPVSGGGEVAFFCRCHGSAFRLDGSVVGGPAPRPLPHYAVTLDGNDVLVDVNTVVDPATRTPT